ncbi:MAG: hypothetical protein RLZZ67_166 [Candidatus Parcubacteria bacterium]|jgi:hypothetical protein
MLITEFYEGQGLGNQLWCYATTRTIAMDKGYLFGFKNPEHFKGFDFMDIELGEQVLGGDVKGSIPPQSLPEGIQHYYAERKILHADGSDIRTYDKTLVNVPDNTKIDGCMQDERYIRHRKDEIRQWFAVKKEQEFLEFSRKDICVINFRGGTYTRDKNFFLRPQYWKDAVAHMRTINPNFKFVVITDDVTTAKKFFPDFDAYHFDTAKDYIIIKNAHYLILSNSSFAFFPAWLSTTLKYCIAPKYWGRHNTSDGYWSLGYNINDGWNYLDREGKIFTSTECCTEFESYLENNKASIKEEALVDPSQKFTPQPLPAKKKIALRYQLVPKVKYIANQSYKKILTLSHIDKLIEKKQERKLKENWLSPQEIATYRKGIKIYDMFSFFNELDILELRLNILDPYVDYFVILEATETFSGHTKPLNFQVNKERFKKWENKIIHYSLTDVPKNEADLRSRLYKKDLTLAEKQTILYCLTSPTAGLDTLHWFREYYIKESQRKALRNLSDNDICYISDLDEIWNPELLIDYSKDDVFKPLQKPYAYFLNNRTNEDWHGWTGTITTKYKNIKNSQINAIRTHKLMESKYSLLSNGGWHFTFQGGYEGAKKKIDDAKHFWYNPRETLANLQARISSNKDFRGRDIKLWVDETGLPKHILENRDKYKKFLK